MEKLSNNLLLLIANLAQQKNKRSIIRLFIQGLNSLLPHIFFSWEEKPGKEESSIEVSTQKKYYGEIKYSDAKLDNEPFVLPKLQNAAQMLAVILERVEQEQLLNDEKAHLEKLVDKRTSELKTQMEAYALLSKKYKVLSDQLKVLLDETEKSKEWLQSILENSSNVFYRHDINHKLTYLSPQVEQILGYEPGEAMVNWTELTTDHPMNKMGYDLTMKAIETGKQQQPYVLELFHKSGRKVFIEVRETPLVKNGRTVAIVGALVDITKQKQAQDKLLKNQYYLKKAQEIGKIGTWELDIQKNILVWTEENYKIFEIPPKTPLTVENFFECVYPADIEYVSQNWEKALNGEPYEVEHRLLIKNKVKWVRQKAYVEFDSNQKPVVAIGFAQDITEQKHAEQKLQESDERHRLLYENAPDGIFLLDKKGKFFDVNPAAGKMTGYSQAELLKMDIKGLTPAEDLGDVKYLLKKLREEGYITAEKPYINKNGEKRYWSFDMVKLSDDQFMAFTKDTTERRIHEEKIKSQNEQLEKSLGQLKQTTDELKTAKEKAEESDRLKSAFLTNMSHEIRTPMNGIIGFIDLIQNTGISGEKREQYLRMIQKSGNRLLYTINDIIEISKIEAGQMDVRLSDEYLNEILLGLYEMFAPDAKKKGLALKFSTDVSNDLMIQTDRIKLESILANLIKNALKFSSEGEIEFGCRLKQNMLEFYVADNGGGIPQDRLEAIFDRFVQGDMEISRAYEGSGLGLSIAKEYVEMFDGKIWAETELGNGSTFYFTIKYVPAGNMNSSNGSQKSGEQAAGFSEKNILIAEDDNASSKLLDLLLSSNSYNLLHARNGNEAVEICKNNPKIDLVLMDLKMPVMDGFEATRQIRRFCKDTPIIAQTAYALSGDREKAIRAGCNDYISKPVRREELLRKIQMHLSNGKVDF